MRKVRPESNLVGRRIQFDADLPNTQTAGKVAEIVSVQPADEGRVNLLVRMPDGTARPVLMGARDGDFFKLLPVEPMLFEWYSVGEVEQSGFTEVSAVPGGVVIRTQVWFAEERGSVAMVFVPGASLYDFVNLKSKDDDTSEDSPGGFSPEHEGHLTIEQQLKRMGKV